MPSNMPSTIKTTYEISNGAANPDMGIFKRKPGVSRLALAAIIDGERKEPVYDQNRYIVYIIYDRIHFVN
jgi:hypothetical protein